VLRVLALFAVGCASAPPCATSTSCARGEVCGLDGRCGALETPAGSRFARSRWIEASDWGVSSTARRPRTDALPIGDGHEVLLSFGPMPERISRALLVLHPHGAFDRVLARGEIVVERVEPFRGGTMPARHQPGPRSFAAAIRPITPGPLRAQRLEVTSAAREAAGRSDRTLYLLVRVDGDARAVFASPWAPRDGAPRLELLVQ
jgi:hypothetical protein